MTDSALILVSNLCTDDWLRLINHISAYFTSASQGFSTDTIQTFVTQCELWNPCCCCYYCCYRCFLSALLWKKSHRVTADLTGRDLIQVKNRAALGKHSITRGMTKLVQYYNQKNSVDYLICYWCYNFFLNFRFMLLLWDHTYHKSIFSACRLHLTFAPVCVSVCLHMCRWLFKKTYG